MGRSTATFSVSLPPEMAAELERVRRHEHRTRSELVREALRGYIRDAARRALKARIAALPEAATELDELAAIASAAHTGKSRSTLAQRRNELRRPARKPRKKKS